MPNSFLPCDVRFDCHRQSENRAGARCHIESRLVDRLAELPNLGRSGRVSGTRELVVPGTRYVIPYRVRGERLEIIAVFHGRQR
jgi:plasmid stabilization system protein ParE